MTRNRSFTHSQFCEHQRLERDHPAHYLGASYDTVRHGRVERWCVGRGPGAIIIDRAGSPECLPAWHQREGGVR